MLTWPRTQEILQLSIPEEYRSAVGTKETAFFSFNGVLRDDSTQEVVYSAELSL